MAVEAFSCRSHTADQTDCFTCSAVVVVLAKITFSQGNKKKKKSPGKKY
jgi:hypothetical protein